MLISLKEGLLFFNKRSFWRGTMKKILALVVVFLVFDRFMFYRIDRSRRHVRIELLRQKKLAKQQKEEKHRLAYGIKPRQKLFTQIRQCCTATS